MLSLSLGNESSGEGSTAANECSKMKQKEIGMWLSLKPPGGHSCMLCNKSFKSLQAMGGHQNAHRNLRFQIKMHNLYLKMIEEEEEKKKLETIQEEDHADEDDDESVGIDLDLHLNFRPATKKVRDSYDFIPNKKMKISCGGGHRDLKASGGGGGADTGKYTAKTVFMKEVDVTLKL